LLVTIIGSISQLFILPTLSSTIGERKVLSTGLLMEFFNVNIYIFGCFNHDTYFCRGKNFFYVLVMQATCLSVAWSPWVSVLRTINSF
jgi:hypothetical protein